MYICVRKRRIAYMDFKELVQKRRSIRKFTSEELSEDEVYALLRAALMSPSSKSSRCWEFVVVDDSETIARIAHSKSAGAEFLEGAPLVIAVIADTTVSDVWIEDASIASYNIQLQAEDMGLGSCWAQIRNRYMKDGTPADEVLHKLLGIPSNYEVLSVIGVGHKAMERQPQNEEKLLWEKVHLNKF